MTMRQYPNPQQGPDLARWPFGMNVMDDLPTMAQGYAQKLDNMEYRKGTLRRRPPFTAKSTEQFDAAASDLIEYVDPDGTSRIVWAALDGKIVEWTAAGSHADRKTGLTASAKASLAQMLGALFHQNGVDRPQRIDTTTAREAGAPLPAGTLSAGAQSAGALTGDFIYMVTACIHDGTRVILESDHSNYVEVTLEGEQQALSWVASADARVNWYRLYRTQEGQGSPFFLVYEANATSRTDNTTDADLSEQLASPLGRNGAMPISRLIAQAGGRLVCANLVDASDPNASRAVHVSIVATNRTEMEYYPDDGVHKFYLPGAGPATAALGYSVKDEDQAAKDLFLSQPTSCYILRGADPFGVLEPISYTKGAVGKKAVVQWGRFLFLVTKAGLEFIGPEGDPILISPHVNAYFFGGGPLALPANIGEEYITLEIWSGKLLVTLRDNSGHAWGNKALTLDLERFNAYSAKPWEESFFTVWYLVGGGMGFFLSMQDGSLLCFDNQNRRLLQRATSGPKDTVNGVATFVRGLIWTSGMMAEFMTFLKIIRQVNILQLCEDDCLLDLVMDYGYRAITGKVIARFTNPIDWDREWDRDWAEAAVYLSSVPVKRSAKGRLCQARIKVENASSEFIFIGLALFYSAVKVRRLARR